MEEYTGVKCLWLEGNGLSKIEGLENLTALKTLYLHENAIETIEGLQNNTELDSLNLSHNFITKIERLNQCPFLTTLNISHNKLSSVQSMEHILLLPSLQTLDLQSNKINEVEVLDILSSLPDLRVLYLMGNPVVKLIPHYRKTVIGRCKQLRYLDDRPVFEEERRRVEAWYEAFTTTNLDAAIEAEKEMLATIRKEKADADEKNFRCFEELMQNGARIKAERESLKAQGGGVNEGGNNDPVVEVNPYSGETVIHVPESSIVTEAREKRWKNGSADSFSSTATVFSTEGAMTETVFKIPSSSSLDPSNDSSDIFPSNEVYSVEPNVEGEGGTVEETTSSVEGEGMGMKKKHESRFMGLLSTAMATPTSTTSPTKEKEEESIEGIKEKRVSFAEGTALAATDSTELD